MSTDLTHFWVDLFVKLVNFYLKMFKNLVFSNLLQFIQNTLGKVAADSQFSPATVSVRILVIYGFSVMG